MGQETTASRTLPGWLKGLFGMRRNDAPAAASATAPAAAPAAEPDAAAERRTALPAPPLAILGAALRVPHGASPAALAAAIARNHVRAELDAELVDGQGFPIMTARCLDAGDAATRDMIAIWLAGEGLAHLAFSDEGWRALTLASAVTDELAAVALTTLAGGAAVADPMPLLELVALLPPEWSATQRAAAGKWLRHRMAQCGWPPARIAPCRAVDDASPAALFASLTRRSADGAGSTPRVTLVVACDSAIGGDTIGRWATDGVLFSAIHSQGILPGEGAAGLLLGDLRHGVAAGSPAPATLTAFEEGRRTTSSDDTKRVDPVLLLGLADRTLRQGGTAAPDVAMLVADTGHRTSRVLELMDYAATMLPHLDDTDDVVRAGLACGNCGIVPFVTALALGWHYARERAAPVVCIGNEDAFGRCVALVRPA